MSRDPDDIWFSGNSLCRNRPKIPRPKVSMPKAPDMKIVLIFAPNNGASCASRRDRGLFCNNPQNWSGRLVQRHDASTGIARYVAVFRAFAPIASLA
jgi:hypothetical protein